MCDSLGELLFRFLFDDIMKEKNGKLVIKCQMMFIYQ
jgi:hypothetical protein